MTSVFRIRARTISSGDGGTFGWAGILRLVATWLVAEALSQASGLMKIDIEVTLRFVYEKVTRDLASCPPLFPTTTPHQHLSPPIPSNFDHGN